MKIVVAIKQVPARDSVLRVNQGATWIQDSDLNYEINEPDAYLVFAPKAPFNKVSLYLKARDPEKERWTGPREAISPDLIARYGVDKVRRGAPGFPRKLEDVEAWVAKARH